jgi:hypothetical protein
VLKRLFESWGPRLEYILRYSILALLDYPNATMLDITRILTDRKFRDKVLTYVKDPVVLNFWTVEFASWNDKFATEAVAPVLNKVGAFTANPLVRNIIGQPKGSFNIRQLMDERKILIVNLSRGLVGEDNAALLGALIVTKIQMAAMSRADINLEDRIPFQLYVDEFQNFATDSFATILSEARKYGLCLTVANQYVAQMMPTVKDAVFGNVGSIIAFRMSADDARTMQRYFEPKFLEYDLIHMHNRHFVISMTIDGEKSQAFSGITLELPTIEQDNSLAIIEASRYTYGTHRSIVDGDVGSQYQTIKQAPAPRQQPKKQYGNKPKEAPKPKQQPAAPVTPIISVEKILRIPLSLLTKPKEVPAPAPAPKPVVAPPQATPPAPVVQPQAAADEDGLIFSRSMHMAPAEKIAPAPLLPIEEIKDTPTVVASEEPAAPAKRKRRRRRSRSKKPTDNSTTTPIH